LPVRSSPSGPICPSSCVRAFSCAVDGDKAGTAGIEAFAMKPLTRREIARTVRMVLDE
jgi:hypothetical protein